MGTEIYHLKCGFEFVTSAKNSNITLQQFSREPETNFGVEARLTSQEKSPPACIQVGLQFYTRY
jgi:hypothetical protein